MWLEPGAAGALTRTEVCDVAKKGTVATGRYQQTGAATNQLILDFTDHQETWTKQ